MWLCFKYYKRFGKWVRPYGRPYNILQQHLRYGCTPMLASLCVLDVSDTRQMHSDSPMLAIAEAIAGHSLMISLEEAGDWHHLPVCGDL